MNQGTYAAIAIVMVWALVAGVIFVINYLDKVKTRRKVGRLQIGGVYTLDGQDPFLQTRVVIDDIMRGYVAYRYIFARDGQPDRFSSLQSEKADSFARMYELCSRPGDTP